MRPPVQYNTYVQSHKSLYIDKVSRGYLICEMIFGLNRVPVFSKVSLVFILLASAYSILIPTGIILYVTLFDKVNSSYPVAGVMHIAKLVFIIAYDFISSKRMLIYYCELNKFDTKTGCRPYTSNASIKSLVLLVVISVLITLLYFLTHVMPQVRKYNMIVLPMHIVDLFEIHYFGHLMNLLTPRMQLINQFVELSLSNTKENTGINNKVFKILKSDSVKSNHEMKNLMDLYHTIIKAYDFLMEATKWQVSTVYTVVQNVVLTFEWVVYIRAKV